MILAIGIFLFITAIVVNYLMSVDELTPVWATGYSFFIVAIVFSASYLIIKGMS